jgi:hypothetical protein
MYLKFRLGQFRGLSKQYEHVLSNWCKICYNVPGHTSLAVPEHRIRNKMNFLPKLVYLKYLPKCNLPLFLKGRCP